MRDVRIEPRTDSGKGRTFRAVCLASVEATSFWEGGGTRDIERPVWAVFAGSEGELRPFATNLAMGRKALVGEGGGYRSYRDNKMELLRSAGYVQTWQREAEGAIVTAFQPDFFRADPGMVDPDGAKFIILAPSVWLDAQKIDRRLIDVHVKRIHGAGLSEDQTLPSRTIALAYLFNLYLDRRTRCPLVGDGRFYVQVMLACLREGLASYPVRDEHSYGQRPFGHHASLGFLEKDDLAAVGIGGAVALKSGHKALEELLAREVELYFTTTKGKP
jgi:hypothetical protein